MVATTVFFTRGPPTWCIISTYGIVVLLVPVILIMLVALVALVALVLRGAVLWKPRDPTR
jgi:hypothetical protein